MVAESGASSRDAIVSTEHATVSYGSECVPKIKYLGMSTTKYVAAASIFCALSPENFQKHYSVLLCITVDGQRLT